MMDSVSLVFLLVAGVIVVLIPAIGLLRVCESLRELNRTKSSPERQERGGLPPRVVPPSSPDTTDRP